MSIVVDLPAPFGPSRATVSPRSIVTSTPRTASTEPNDFGAAIDRGDYLGTAQDRLGEQVTDATETVKAYAAEKAAAAQEKARAYATTARETVQQVAGSAVEQASESLGHARETATAVSQEAVNAAQRATSRLGRALPDEGVRDQLLLGIAGLAVTAALGIAYQRRPDNRGRSWD